MRGSDRVGRSDIEVAEMEAAEDKAGVKEYWGWAETWCSFYLDSWSRRTLGANRA